MRDARAVSTRKGREGVCPRDGKESNVCVRIRKERDPLQREKEREKKVRATLSASSS